jgi:hypothetical protein
MTGRQIEAAALYILRTLRDFEDYARLRIDGMYREIAVMNALDEAQEEWEDNHDTMYERRHIAALVNATLDAK